MSILCFKFQLKFRKRCKLFHAVPFLSDSNIHIAHCTRCSRYIHTPKHANEKRGRERERSLCLTVNLFRRLISELLIIILKHFRRFKCRSKFLSIDFPFDSFASFLSSLLFCLENIESLSLMELLWWSRSHSFILLTIQIKFTIQIYWNCLDFIHFYRDLFIQLQFNWMKKIFFFWCLQFTFCISNDKTI